MTTPQEALTDSIDSSKPERIVYRALRNLIINEWNISKDTIVQRVSETVLGPIKADVPGIIDRWLNSSTVRDFVSKTVRETVKGLVEPVLRTEIRAFLDRHIKLTAAVVSEEGKGG